jgi:ribosomal protein L37E
VSEPASEPRGGERARRSIGPRLLVARLLCAVAACGLPRYARGRFAQEWRADLATDPEHAVRYAASLLLHIVRLRAAVTARGAVRDRQAVPVACRLRLHRYVTVHDNPENLRFTSHQCRRCGHIKDDWRGPNPVNDGVMWGASAGIH